MKIYSTDAVEPESRGGYWRETVAKRFARFEVDFDSTPEDRLSAAMRKKTAGPASAFEISTTPYTTRGPCEPVKDRSVFVVLQMEGQTRCTQGGHSQWLKPDDFVILDAARELELHKAGHTRLLVLSCPLAAAPAELGNLLPLAGNRIDGGQGAGRVASHFMQVFIEQAETLTETQVRRQLHSLADVLNTAVLSLGEQTPGASTKHQAFHIHRIKLSVDDQLGDPNLTPAKIAAAHGISRRYLSKLFANQGVSLSRYIWERRLDQCRRVLDDPCTMGMSITEIAFSWGFNSASHFSRAFKDRFGVSPKEARDLARTRRRIDPG